MENSRRGPTFSADPGEWRDGQREHWIPLEPEGGDLHERHSPPAVSDDSGSDRAAEE